jgi:uncharacterized repeat protein (TIGR01451 family)
VKVDVTNQTGQFNASCANFPVAFTNQGIANPPANIGGLVNIADAITQSCIVVNATPSLNKAFLPTTIANGGTSTLTFTVTNPASNNAAQVVSFVDSLPSGLKIAAVPNVQQTCTGGTITAAAGATTITVAGVTVGPSTGVASTCTVKVDVTNQTGQFNASCANFPVAFTNQGIANPPANISGLVNITDAVTQSCIVVNSFTFGITKTPSAAQLASGDPLTFTIVVTNIGPSSANNSLLTDVIPAGFTPSGITCTTASNGAACPAGGTVTLGNLTGAGIVLTTFPATGTITFSLAGTFTLSSGSLTNTATVSPPPGVPVAPQSAQATVSAISVEVPVPTTGLPALLALMLLLGIGGGVYAHRRRRS